MHNLSQAEVAEDRSFDTVDKYVSLQMNEVMTKSDASLNVRLSDRRGRYDVQVRGGMRGLPLYRQPSNEPSEPTPKLVPAVSAYQSKPSVHVRLILLEIRNNVPERLINGDQPRFVKLHVDMIPNQDDDVLVL